MHKRAFSVLTAALLATVLTGCGDSRVINAGEIIKKSLLAPSSFSLVSGKEVWSGKNAEGNLAHIVRVEYDAQNGFGAMIRDCKLVAYSDKGSNISWQTNGAMEACGSNPLYGEAQMVEWMRRSNFEK